MRICISQKSEIKDYVQEPTLQDISIENGDCAFVDIHQSEPVEG